MFARRGNGMGRVQRKVRKANRRLEDMGVEI